MLAGAFLALHVAETQGRQDNISSSAALAHVRVSYHTLIPALASTGLHPKVRMRNILLASPGAFPLPRPQVVGNLLSDLWYARMSPQTCSAGELMIPVY